MLEMFKKETMTPQDLETLKRMLEEATPGPWTFGSLHIGKKNDSEDILDYVHLADIPTGVAADDSSWLAFANLVCRLHRLAPELIASAEALAASERRVKELEAACAVAFAVLEQIHNTDPLIWEVSYDRMRETTKAALSNLPRSTQDLMRLVEAAKVLDKHCRMYGVPHGMDEVEDVVLAYRAFKGERT